MPRARKKKSGEPTPIAPVIEELARKYDLVPASELPAPRLLTFEEKAGEVMPHPDEPLPPLQRAEIQTARPFVGRVASGRGRVVEAHDGDYSIEAFKNPLTGPEVALCQRNGLDVMSDDGEAVTLMAGEKKAIREAGGDINWVARAVTGKDAGRSR